LKLNLAPVVIAGIGSSPWIPADTRSNPMNVGISVVISATAAYVIEATLDDPYATGGIVNLFAPNLSPVLSGTSTAAYTVTNQFLTAIRVRTTASTGPVTVQVWQSESTQGA